MGVEFRLCPFRLALVLTAGFAGFGLVGCDVPDGPEDAGLASDGGRSSDAGPGEDAGTHSDAGGDADAGNDVDAGAADDAGLPDAGPDAGALSCLEGTEGGGWRPLTEVPRAFTFAASSVDAGVLLAIPSEGHRLLLLDRGLQELAVGLIPRGVGGWSAPELHALADGPALHAVSTFAAADTRSVGALFPLDLRGMPLPSSDGGAEQILTFEQTTAGFHLARARSSVSADGSEVIVAYSSESDRSVWALRVRRDGTVTSGPTEVFAIPGEVESSEIFPVSVAVAHDAVILAVQERGLDLGPNRVRVQRFLHDWTPLGEERVLESDFLPPGVELIAPPSDGGGSASDDVSVLVSWANPTELRLWNRVFDGGVPTTLWMPPARDGGLVSLWPQARRDALGAEFIWLELRWGGGDAPSPKHVWSQREGFPPMELTAASGPLFGTQFSQQLEVVALEDRRRVVFTTTGGTDGGAWETIEALEYCVP